MANCRVIKTITGLSELEEQLKTEQVIACDLETSGLDIFTVDLEGIGLGTSKQQFFIAFPNKLDHKDISTCLANVFKDKYVVFHNAKYDLKMLRKCNFPLPQKIHDTMLMSWLIDENTLHGLKALTRRVLDKETKDWKQLNRTIDLFTTADDLQKELADYCGEDVSNTYQLYYKLFPQVKLEGALIDYERIEIPLVFVLVEMEYKGVQLDTAWLTTKRDEIKRVIDNLEIKMWEKAGDNNINIQSPKQLENLLFNKLNYKPVKVTDSGKRSTDNEVLNELVKQNKLKENDFVPLLLRYRELSKLYSTYFVSLLEQKDTNNVIHTHFLQHRTRTGRLASNKPNLQNIPERDDEWNVRRAFISRRGFKFLIADYSQIELRMLAHYSLDDNMVKTFKEDGDIHAMTMKLTGTKRKEAKGINFGLIYGMGPRTLAQMLEIPEDRAKRYIHRFFSGYPKVQAFTYRIQQQALDKGYVEMITGRKRRFREIKDKRWYNMIQRQAINSKIQGSAADLIKIAMIKLQGPLEKIGAYQLLQIHDEIIVEVPENKLEEGKKIIREVMEKAVKLRVPIKTGMVVGNYWIKG